MKTGLYYFSATGNCLTTAKILAEELPNDCDIISFAPAKALSLTACCDLFRRPLSPVSIAIETPAKINNTIIVITNAINVIPF